MSESPVELISITPGAEQIMAYCARVSSPNQENPEIDKLLRYCIKSEHWSIFTMANMCLGLRTSRGISPQILRHWTFDIQEFSQRYAAATDFILYEARRQDTKDRQNSIDDLSDEDKQWFIDAQLAINDHAFGLYKEALDRDIAKECARFLLTLGTETRLYLNANIRTWIHYLQLRTGNGTQLEHKVLAEACKEIFIEQLPIVSKALGWIE